MMESAYFNNGNFREYSYSAGEFCSLETGIPGGPVCSSETECNHHASWLVGYSSVMSIAPYTIL